MRKIIFGQPICNTQACCNNDPNYPSNCSIWASAEGCCIAEIQYPNLIQRALAWIDKHWLKLALALTGASFIIWYSMFMWGAAANSVIRNLRAEQDAWAQTLGNKSFLDKERRLFRKHGYMNTVVYEPGKTPWYVNKKGQRCKFV